MKLLVIAATAVSAVVIAQPATASPAAAAGTIVTTGIVPVGSRSADGNVFLDLIETGTFAGTFTGTFVADASVVIHASGDAEFHGRVVFTGTVAGCGAGTVVFHLEGQGVGPVNEGTFGTLAGQGSLPVHMQGSVSQVGVLATYDGKYHC
jgi:hypothetical protein